MIHIDKRVAISSPGGCTAAEYEQFCRLYFAGALHLSPPCLSTFRAQNHRSNILYLPWLHWYQEGFALTNTGCHGSGFVPSNVDIDPHEQAQALERNYEQLPTSVLREGRDWTKPAPPPRALPIELMVHIHSYVNTPIEEDQSALWRLREEKLSFYRTLEACVLVCTHWANYFRPVLFEHRLRDIKSIDQMRSMKSMMCWAGTRRISSLQAYTTQKSLSASLTIAIQEDKKPTCLWFHHLGLLNISMKDCLLHIRPKAPRNLSSTIDLQACTFLPKTVLPCTFRPFTELTLQDARVPSLEMLLRFLRQFSRLRKVSLHRMTFQKPHQHIIPYSASSTQRLPSRPVEICVERVWHEPTNESGNHTLFKDIMNSISPELRLPICALPFSDGVVAQTLLTGCNHAATITSTNVRLRTIWDGNSDAVYFYNECLPGTSVVSFTCPKKPASGHALSDYRLLSSVCLHLTTGGPGYTDPLEYMSGFDFPSLFRLIREATAITVVLLSFNDLTSTKEFFNQNPSLPHLPTITYRLACRRHKDFPIRATEEGILNLDTFHLDDREPIGDLVSRPELKFDSHWYVKTVHQKERSKISEYGDFFWELIDPETLQLTGDRFFEHDNIVPELLRRRGIQTVVSPDCPSEDEIRAMLEAKAQTVAQNLPDDGHHSDDGY